MPVEEKIEEQIEDSFRGPDRRTVEEVPILTRPRHGDVSARACCRLTWAGPARWRWCRRSGENRLLGVVSQIDPREDAPEPKDLYEVGTVAMIHKVVRMKEDLLLFCEGVSRMRTLAYTATEPYLKAQIERLPEMEPEPTPELEALRRDVAGMFQQIVSASPNLSDDLATASPTPTSSGAWRIWWPAFCPA